MANPLVDQITHPGNEDEFPLDLDAVVSAAVRYNVILELNDHSFDPHSSRVASTAPRARVRSRPRWPAERPVSIGSDAHYALHVGRFDAALAIAEELGFSEDRIVNRSADAVLDAPAGQARAAAARRRRSVGVADDSLPRRARSVVVQRVLKSRRIRDFALMTAGIVMTAWSLDAFLIPNKIAAGGVSGLSTVIYYWAKGTFGLTIPVGTQMLVMNAILIFVAWRFRGGRYLAKTLYGAVGLSVLVDVMAPFTPHLAAGRPLARGAVGRGDRRNRHGARLQGRREHRWNRHRRAAHVPAGPVRRRPDHARGRRVRHLAGCAAVRPQPRTLRRGRDLRDDGVHRPGPRRHLGREGGLDHLGLRRCDRQRRSTTTWAGERRGSRPPASTRGRGAARCSWCLSRNEIDDLKAIVKELDPTAMVIISNVHEAIGEGFKEMAG